MTLLASERSLFIRNKFRSVLQLRIQNRRQNEMKADSELKSTCLSHKGEKDQSETLRLTEDGATQTLPPSGLNTQTATGTDRSVCGAQRWNNTYKLDVHNETAQHRPTSQEKHRKHSLPMENLGSVTIPVSTDVFEDDVSSCSSSSSEQHKAHQSPAFSSSPGFAGDQLLSELSPVGLPSNHSHSHTQSGLALHSATEGINQPISLTLVESNSMAMTRRVNGMHLTSQNSPLLPKTARPSSPSCSSCLSPTLNSNRLPRPRKTRDTKPKMRKLKYHQYIPPDQRGGSGTGGGEAKNKSPASGQTLDPAYSRLLKQQQVFLQLQILQSQQQQPQQQPQQQLQQQQLQQQQQQPQQKEPLPVSPSRESNQTARLSGAVSQNAQSVPATANHTPVDTYPTHKPELLPSNLVDLTVSELRQQLRKRGLPVSGTKPALLQRLRPFQLPRTCLTPGTLCQLGTNLDPLTACPLPPSNQSPSLSSSSGPDSPCNIQPSGAANGTLSGAHNGPSDGVPNAVLSGIPSGLSNAVSVSVPSETYALASAVYLAPACTPSESPSPSLPLSSSSSSTSASPLQCGALWGPGQEQQELGVELQMRERIRSRHRKRSFNTDTPFLQQGAVCPSEKPEADGQTDILFTQIFCCRPCDVTGQDFELPVQITASPVQTSPGVRTLEDELQEAIQKAQMDPSQSIDDILDESLTCVNSVVPSALKSPDQLSASPPLPSPSPHADHSRASQDHLKDDNFLSSPLCSSLLLELPPSPSSTAPLATPPPPPPPPPPLCTSPLVSFGSSRKRRAPATFDAGDWLEMLTSGFRPLTPPAAPFVEADFSLDSDLNVNRVLDLMVEQW